MNKPLKPKPPQKLLKRSANLEFPILLQDLIKKYGPEATLEEESDYDWNYVYISWIEDNPKYKEQLERYNQRVLEYNEKLKAYNKYRFGQLSEEIERYREQL